MTNFKKLAITEMGRLSVVDFKQTQKLPVCVVLDNVRSAYNVGAVFRTADALAIEKYGFAVLLQRHLIKKLQKLHLALRKV